MMFCRNCGTENEANAAFCKSCGAPMEVENGQNPAVEPETATAPTPKKRKKILPAIIAVAAIIVVALAVILIGFKNTLVIKVASAEKQQMYAFDQLADDITDAYGDVVSSLDATGARGSLKIELGETAKSLISQSGIDLSAVNSAELTYDISKVDNITAMTAALNYNGEQLIEAQVAIDTEAGVLTLSIPALNDKALKVDISEFTDGVESFDISIPEIMPDTSLVEKILPRYIDVALGAIKDVERSSETFTVSGVSQKATCYTTVFNERLFAEMVLEVIKEAREDADLESIIFDFIAEMNKLSAPEDVENAQEIYDEFIKEIDEAIAEFADETFSEETLATLKVWVNGKFGIIGAQVDIVDNGVVFIGSAESGADTASEISVTAEGEKVFELVSKGTLKRGIFDGTMVISAEGQEIINVKAEGVDTETEGAFIGKLTFTVPGFAEVNPALAMLSFSFEGTKENNIQTFSCGAGMGDGMLFNIIISTEKYAAEKGALHENVTEDAGEWAMEIAQSDKFAKILEDSGLNDLISAFMFLPTGDNDYLDDYDDYSDTEELSDEELGYEDGYTDGYYDGMSADYKAGYGDCVNEEKADVAEYMSAYDSGYEDGYKDGVADSEAFAEAA